MYSWPGNTVFINPDVQCGNQFFRSKIVQPVDEKTRIRRAQAADNHPRGTGFEACGDIILSAHTATSLHRLAGGLQ
jgi:hypothetical protein